MSAKMLQESLIPEIWNEQEFVKALSSSNLPLALGSFQAAVIIGVRRLRRRFHKFLALCNCTASFHKFLTLRTANYFHFAIAILSVERLLASKGDASREPPWLLGFRLISYILQSRDCPTFSLCVVFVVKRYFAHISYEKAGSSQSYLSSNVWVFC